MREWPKSEENSIIRVGGNVGGEERLADELANQSENKIKRVPPYDRPGRSSDKDLVLGISTSQTIS